MAMFKFKAPTKKKKRKLVTTSIRDDESSADEADDGLKKKQLSNHNDDDEDHDADVEDHGLSTTGKTKKSMKKDSKKSKKKKRKVTTGVSNGAISFIHDDEEMEEEGEHVLAGKDIKSKKKDKKKKKKSKLTHTTKGGLGFGGANFLSHLDDGDDDDEDENVSKKGIKRSRFGMGKLEQSIIHDDEDDDDGDALQIKEEDKDDKIEAGVSPSSLYGKEALAKLKAEQKKMKQPSTDETYDKQASNKAKEEKDTKSHSGTDSITVPLPPKPTSMQKPKPPTAQQNDMDNDFIPLDSSYRQKDTSSHLNIVTGDEALLYAGELDGGDDDGINKANLGTETLSNIPATQNTTATHDVLAGVNGDKDNGKNDGNQDVEMDEGGRKWEEEIARRAGVTPNNGQKNTTARPSNITTHSNAQVQMPKESGSKVIKDVKSTIRSTLHNLTQMDLDLESNIGRRGHDEEISNEDATKKEKELEDIGNKFEYYQNLRVKLADWIGALRYMSERVTMVENAINNLNYEFATKDEKVWKEWEDDVIANLKDRGLLDYVVGRQPEVKVNEGNDVDEFGRDRRSLESLARTKRESTRCRVRAESKDRRRTKDLNNLSHTQKGFEFDDSDLDLSDNEMMDREERRSAVSDAIGVVVDEMDDEYSTPSKLIKVFETWQNLYGEDFDQCYAKLAFVDLMNVFVRCESCQKIDLLRLAKKADSDKTNFHDFSWFTALQQFQQSQEKMMIDKVNKQNVFVKTNQVVSKLSDTLLSVFKNPDSGFGCYNPFSTKQTKSLVSFFETMKSHLDEDEYKTLLEDTSQSILQHINNFVQNQSIPIIKKSQQRSEPDDFAIFAITGQLHRLEKLLINLLDWYDALKGEAKVDIGKFCLMDLIGYRILPILNSIEGGVVNDLDPKLFLKKIKDLIQTKQMLDNQNFSLSSAPLRAALSKLGQE